MNVKDELLYDFSINMPRLLVSGNTGIIDNVKKIVYITESSIVVDHGSRFSAVSGDNLRIKLIEEEIHHIPNPKIKEIAMRNLKEIEEGKRDFRF